MAGFYSLTILEWEVTLPEFFVQGALDLTWSQPYETLTHRNSSYLRRINLLPFQGNSCKKIF